MKRCLGATLEEGKMNFSSFGRRYYGKFFLRFRRKSSFVWIEFSYLKTVAKLVLPLSRFSLVCRAVWIASFDSWNIAIAAMSLDSVVNTVLTRLEQVASRLEKIEKQIASGAAPAGGAAASAASGDSSASVAAFDAIVDEHLTGYYKISEEIGGPVAQQGTKLAICGFNAPLPPPIPIAF